MGIFEIAPEPVKTVRKRQVLNQSIASAMGSILLLFCLLTLTVCNTFGFSTEEASTVTKAPSNHQEKFDLLERIILTWNGNPATSQAVTWRTAAVFNQATAEIAPADPSPDLMKKSRRFIAQTMPLQTEKGSTYYHSVSFTNLRPNTLYAYRIGHGNVWSEWFQFRTASSHADPFVFIYFGDAQQEIFSLWSRTIRTAILTEPRARFMIHAGDMVDHANSDREWDEWFNAGGWVFATIPSIPVAGNHEYINWTQSKPILSKYWRPQFTLPEVGIEGLAETVYYLDYQGARIIVLNSNDILKEQAKWVEQLLAQNPNQWTIITFHHPVYSSVMRRDNKKLRDCWQPIFNKFNVDLVLQGHDHVYARGNGLDISKDEKDQKRNTPVYVVSVSGPKMYPLDPVRWMDRAGENLQLFQVISISHNILSYKSMTVRGEVYDAFDLVKNAHGKRVLINKTPPDLAEHRFESRQ
jgi:3',5'-cyclic AMP phosphodiesterase CpdA